MKKFIKDMLKSFVCGTLIGSICCCYAVNATAASAHGQSKTAYVDGVSFTMQNALYTGSYYANAYTYNTASQSLSAGSIGVKPILYDSNDYVVAEGDWHYSNSTSSGISAYAGIDYYSPYYYYSWGYAHVWNGSYYDEYRPERTTNLRPTT